MCMTFKKWRKNIEKLTKRNVNHKQNLTFLKDTILISHIPEYQIWSALSPGQLWPADFRHGVRQPLRNPGPAPGEGHQAPDILREQVRSLHCRESEGAKEVSIGLDSPPSSPAQASSPPTPSLPVSASSQSSEIKFIRKSPCNAKY